MAVHDLAGICQCDWLRHFTRTSYTISRGSITLQEFPVIIKDNPLFFQVKTARIFNSLNLGQAVFTELPEFSDFN